MSKTKREYETQGSWRFRTVILGWQTSTNGWGSGVHRIVQLAPNLTTVMKVGRDESFQSPAIFDHRGCAFIVMTQYFEDESSMMPEVIYQLTPPPDSNAARKSFGERVGAIMSKNSKLDIATAIGLSAGAVSEVPKREVAEGAIRIIDNIGNLKADDG